MISHLDNPKHWQDRADETRAKADQFWFNEKEKQRMLRIAEEYELLARRAEERQSRVNRSDGK